MDGSALWLKARPAPRRAVAEDIPFLVDLARERYRRWALGEAAAWAANFLTLPYGAIFICGSSVAIVSLEEEFWRPGQMAADLVLLYGRPVSDDPGAILRVTRAAMAWAREKGAYCFRFGLREGANGEGLLSEETTRRFAAFAKRLGARHYGTTYALEL